MDRATFLKEEYSSLRDEIKQTKDRLFKIITLGVTIIPAVQFLADEFQASVVVLATPILVIVFGMLYLSENRALMRCGYYIRDRIESGTGGGWETWLESNPKDFDTRDVDKYVAYCFHMVFVLYYIGSVYLSTRQAIEQFGGFQQIPTILLFSAHISIGIWFFVFLFRNIRVSTSK